MDMVYGAIIGDIVGSVYEFHNIKTKDFPLFKKGCTFTDDTVMTIAIARALLTKFARDEMGTATDEEWITMFAKFMRLYGIKHPFCGYGGKFIKWVMNEDMGPYNSCGNGSAMRVSAIPLFCETLEQCERLARLSAEPTHNHPDGIAGAQATAGATFLAAHGAKKSEIKEYVEKYYPVNFTLDEIRDEYHFGKFQALNAGTVPYAVEAFLESESYEDAIRNAISIGGDSDTLGAICGAIAGAYYGVPHDLQDKVHIILDGNFDTTLYGLDHLHMMK